MRESVIYQEIEAQGLQRGLQQGRQEGILEGERSLIIRQINRRLGTLSPLGQAQIAGLNLRQLEALADALFGFTQLEDLEAWLEKH